MRQPLSLKARALQLLAQREHSRSELRRKLLRVRAGASSTGALTAAQAEAESAPQDEPDDAVRAEAVEALLDALQAAGHLSEERFVESRIHSRSPRLGLRRIEQELRQHGVELDAQSARELRLTEQARAYAVWQRKFGAPPQDAAERARQMRFLAGRGFSMEAIQAVIRGIPDDLHT